MNNMDILMIGLSWLFISAILFRIVFIKKNDEGKFKIVVNKFKLTLFGKISSAILCSPIFALFGICTMCYFAVVKRK